MRDICRSERLAVILVTHDLRLSGKVADRLIYLEGGRILEEGAGTSMLLQPRTAEFQRFLKGPETERE